MVHRTQIIIDFLRRGKKKTGGEKRLTDECAEEPPIGGGEEFDGLVGGGGDEDLVAGHHGHVPDGQLVVLEGLHVGPVAPDPDGEVPRAADDRAVAGRVHARYCKKGRSEE